MSLIIMRSTAALSYHLRLLSSLIRVTVGGPTSPFVGGHIAGSLWTGLPPGGDPFVHHGVTHTENKHELELSLALSLSLFFLSLCLPAHYSVLLRPSFPSCPSIRAKLRQAGGQIPLWSWVSASGGNDIWTETHHSLSDVCELKTDSKPVHPPDRPSVCECVTVPMPVRRVEVRSWLSKRNSCVCLCETRSCGWTSRPWPLKISEGQTTMDGLKLGGFVAGWARNCERQTVREVLNRGECVFM